MAGNPDPRYVKSGEPITASWANTVVASIKRQTGGRGRFGLIGGGPAGPICPFGEIISEPAVSPEEPPVQKIRGGILGAGDKTFNVPNYDIQINSDREVLIFLRVNLTANTDDDQQLLLPGIKTSTWEPEMEEAPPGIFGNYPDGTPPSLPDGDGIYIAAVGQLTVLDGIATFLPTGCGGFFLDHCSGSFFQSNSRPMSF